MNAFDKFSITLLDKFKELKKNARKIIVTQSNNKIYMELK